MLGEAFGTDVEGDGGGGAVVVNGALARLTPLLDFLVEVLEVLICLVQQAPSLLQLLQLRNVLLLLATTYPRLQPIDLPS